MLTLPSKMGTWGKKTTFDIIAWDYSGKKTCVVWRVAVTHQTQSLILFLYTKTDHDQMDGWPDGWTDGWWDKWMKWCFTRSFTICNGRPIRSNCAHKLRGFFSFFLKKKSLQKTHLIALPRSSSKLGTQKKFKHMKHDAMQKHMKSILLVIAQ